MQNPVFKSAIETDVPEILGLIKAFYAIDGYDFEKVKIEKSVRTFINDTNLGELWILKQNTETIGYVCVTLGFSFEYGGKIAVLDELYIKDAFRNQGLGKICLAFVDDFAKEKNIQAIHMEVEGHNEAALGLYTSRGFKTKGRRLYTKTYA